ncbi:hypothetical protein [Acidisarcina polymorpha]|uniref:hypothetical protein n=1 Tax=Acidisarcina polymorpha TaxID=2211140 RepID=UPI003083FD9F
MNEERALFGTDGIRGIAGEYPLDPKTIYATGMALAHFLRAQVSAPRVILGADTRESSPHIAAVISQGLEAGGAAVLNAGVITTPGIAFLARKHGLAAGIVAVYRRCFGDPQAVARTPPRIIPVLPRRTTASRSSAAMAIN